MEGYHDRRQALALAARRVAGVSLVAAADYTMTRLEFAPYVAMLSAEQVAYFTDVPTWVTMAWAVGVWAGLLGAADLVFDLRFSALAFAIAAIANAIAAVWFVVLAAPPVQVAIGQGAMWLVFAMVGVPFLLWLYSRQLHAAGILR